MVKKRTQTGCIYNFNVAVRISINLKKIISILFIALWVFTVTLAGVFTVTLAGCGHNGEDTAGSGTDI